MFDLQFERYMIIVLTVEKKDSWEKRGRQRYENKVDTEGVKT
jgi:hypothetical protein